ncbi:MAG: VOC family protein [Acidobacteria bacterium]|nr:VOC family protein [Acidobacteriota bacterium]
MVIDHIGIVVSSLQEAIKEWTEIFGYRQLTEIVANTRQRVRVVFMEKENSVTIKLIEPDGAESPVHKYSLRGGGLHHLCFKCDNVESGVKRLESMGMRLLSPPQPGEAFDNNSIAFVYAQNMGLNIELIDTDIKACRLKQI